MADELEKLREKIEKEPNSKLFVSLADMYRKAGQLDQAIEVLKQGIERQPNYTSARVVLAKIYIEKEMKKEAKEEFEIVVKAIPDNLYSQKKLAEIYSEEGDLEAAQNALKAVIKLNPMDEEAPSMLARLEEEIAEAAKTAAAEAEKATEVPITEEPASSEEITAPEAEMSEESVVGGLSFEREPSTEAGDENWLKNTFDMSSPDNTDSTEEGNKPKPAVKEEMAAKEETTVKEEMEVEKTAAGGVTEADFILSPAEAEQPEIIHESEIPGRTIIEEAPTAGAVQPETPPPDDSGLYEVAELPEDFVPEPVVPEKATDPGSLDRVDGLVKKGKYGEAFSMLSKMLSFSPGDRMAKERFEELKMLIKILGKEKEVRAGRLTSFLGAVRKRRDEFFGNS